MKTKNYFCKASYFWNTKGQAFFTTLVGIVLWNLNIKIELFLKMLKMQCATSFEEGQHLDQVSKNNIKLIFLHAKYEWYRIDPIKLRILKTCINYFGIGVFFWKIAICNGWPRIDNSIKQWLPFPCWLMKYVTPSLSAKRSSINFWCVD